MNQSIHFEIPRQKLFIREHFLYDMIVQTGQHIEADLIEITSYPGHSPTFTAVIENKFLFHYLPIFAFTTNKTAPVITASDSHYFNCPSEYLSVYTYQNIDKVLVFNKEKNRLGFGKYLMSFDWYKDNELCHLVALNDGNLVLTPSHKMIINGEWNTTLPSFKKLHYTWKV